MPTPDMSRFVRSRLARASSATLVALAFAACSDSTGPTNTIPTDAEAEQAAFVISDELVSSLSNLTAGGAMNAPYGAFATRSLAPFRTRAAAARAECGSYSPATPLDGDADGIPDVVTVSFTLPDCRTVDELGGIIDLTGQLHLEDESSESGNISFSLGLTNLRIAITDPEQGTVTVTQNGSGSVTHTVSTLEQVHNFVTAVSAFGQSASVTANWNNEFESLGGAIVAGESLPDGVFSPTGTTVWRQGPNQFTFALSTPDGLSYDAACAADPFTYPNPFSNGELHINITGGEGTAYVEVAYLDCDEPTITYHGTVTR